jgi:hypothetical protein
MSGRKERRREGIEWHGSLSYWQLGLEELTGAVAPGKMHWWIALAVR